MFISKETQCAPKITESSILTQLITLMYMHAVRKKKTLDTSVGYHDRRQWALTADAVMDDTFNEMVVRMSVTPCVSVQLCAGVFPR